MTPCACCLLKAPPAAPLARVSKDYPKKHLRVSSPCRLDPADPEQPDMPARASMCKEAAAHATRTEEKLHSHRVSSLPTPETSLP
jgi:hypothetical protein